MNEPQLRLVSSSDWLPQAEWEEFLEHRKELHRPVTQVGAKRLLAKLKRFYDEGQDLKAVLDRSMENGWTGLFAIPAEKSSRQSLLQRAQTAWLEVRAAIRRGACRIWSDSLTQRAIEAVGGWLRLSDLKSEQAEFVARQFERAFLSLAR